MNTEANSHENQSELDTINNLTVSNKLKEKIRLVHENVHGTKLGFPNYKTLQNTASNRMAIGGKLFSVWAFLFGPLYYFAKGMWRKGVALIGITCLLMMAVAVMTDNEVVFQLVSLFPGVICSQCAYPDLYRKLVKNEVFWW